jgi:hypothetical protein
VKVPAWDAPYWNWHEPLETPFSPTLPILQVLEEGGGGASIETVPVGDIVVPEEISVTVIVHNNV